MCRKNFVFWFCMFLLLVVLPSKSWQNSTSNENKNDNLTKIHTNLTIIEDKDDSLSYEYIENFIEENNKSNIVPYEMCYNVTCIQFCCPFGDVLYKNDTREIFCIPGYNNYTITHFPNVYTNDLLQSENKKVDELFQLTIYNPCLNSDYIFLSQIVKETIRIFANGSIYLPYSKIFVKSTSYCFIAIPDEDEFDLIICSETLHEVLMFFDPPPWNQKYHISSYRIHLIVGWVLYFTSTLFIVIIFLVYSILPELRNVHGFMLRNYIGSKFVIFIMFPLSVLGRLKRTQYSICFIIGFLEYVFSFALCFWLIIMSFDTWRTFRGLYSLQSNIRQRKRNKLVFYMLFAWGLSLLLAIIYVILEVVSEYLPKILQPKLCGASEKTTALLYFYGFESICVIGSVCLSISTTVNIERYEKGTSDHLSDSQNNQYNGNKKWFKLCQKLFILKFIVILLKYLIEKTSWLLNYDSITISIYIMYAGKLLEFMENFCTFIIYVWKKEINHMLLKRFSCGLFKQT